MASGPGKFEKKPQRPNRDTIAIQNLATEVLETNLGENCLNYYLTIKGEDGNQYERIQTALMQIRRDGTVGNHSATFEKALVILGNLQRDFASSEKLLGSEIARPLVEVADKIDTIIIPKIRTLAENLAIELNEPGKRNKR